MSALLCNKLSDIAAFLKSSTMLLLLQFSCFYIFFPYFPILHWTIRKKLFETFSSKGDLADKFKYWILGTVWNVFIISV